jgi:hypothetical protein
VILDASDELFVFTVVLTVVILPAKEDDRLVWVAFELLIDAANDALFVVVVVERVSMRVAIELLLVVTAPFVVVILAASEELAEVTLD